MSPARTGYDGQSGVGSEEWGIDDRNSWVSGKFILEGIGTGKPHFALSPAKRAKPAAFWQLPERYRRQRRESRKRSHQPA